MVLVGWLVQMETRNNIQLSLVVRWCHDTARLKKTSASTQEIDKVGLIDWVPFLCHLMFKCPCWFYLELSDPFLKCDFDQDIKSCNHCLVILTTELLWELNSYFSSAEISKSFSFAMFMWKYPFLSGKTSVSCSCLPTSSISVVLMKSLTTFHLQRGKYLEER